MFCKFSLKILFILHFFLIPIQLAPELKLKIVCPYDQKMIQAKIAEQIGVSKSIVLKTLLSTKNWATCVFKRKWKAKNSFKGWYNTIIALK